MAVFSHSVRTGSRYEPTFICRYKDAYCLAECSHPNDNIIPFFWTLLQSLGLSYNAKALSSAASNEE